MKINKNKNSTNDIFTIKSVSKDHVGERTLSGRKIQVQL